MADCKNFLGKVAPKTEWSKQQRKYVVCSKHEKKETSAYCCPIRGAGRCLETFFELYHTHSLITTAIKIIIFNLYVIFMDPCIVDYSVEIPARCSFVIEFIMFRVAHRSSLGALNCICSLCFMCPCGDRPLPRLSGKSISHSALTTAGHHTTWTYKPEAANTV